MACLSDSKPKAGSPKARLLRKAQHGHSLTEEAIYWYLWSNSGRDPNDYRREARGGYNTIGAAIGVGPKTVKRALHSLENKHAIETIPRSWDSIMRQGTAYWVYSRRAIVERRKAAGLTHYIRDRGGVTLCVAPAGIVCEGSATGPGGSKALQPGLQGPHPSGLRVPNPQGTEPPQIRPIRLDSRSSSEEHAVSPEKPIPARKMMILPKVSPNKDSDSIRAALLEFFSQQGLPVPAGSIPHEEIATLMAQHGARLEDLRQFLTQKYRERLKEPPATWKHPLVSVRNWLAEFRKPLPKSGISNIPRDNAATEWLRERKKQA
jgi:hypothetical protein